MKKTIMPWFARILSSEMLLRSRRRLREFTRRLLGQDHQIDVFLRVDDPFSYLLVQVLPELSERFNVRFCYHIVSSQDKEMYPEPDLWQQQALKDSVYIASEYKLMAPGLGYAPGERQTEAAIERLITIDNQDCFLEKAISVFRDYWQSGSCAKDQGGVDGISSSSLQKLTENNQLLHTLGHYLSASLYYEGEWYWGIDRLSHLEQRLNDLSLSRAPKQILYQQSTKNFCKRAPKQVASQQHDVSPLIIYFSARSPYSYLGLERGVLLAKHYGLPIEIRPVLPMLMRGMAVPEQKKWYIFSDTKREALKLGIDYGFVADPLGPGVQRCYALFEYAKSKGKEVSYLLSFARAVNAQGIRSDTDRGMQKIVETAGLDWSQAKPLMDRELASGEWYTWAEDNYSQMRALGLWGVPSFVYKDVAVWGQDRIDVVERRVCELID